MLSLAEELTLLAQGGWVQLQSLALGSRGSGTSTWWGCMWVSLSSFVAQVSLLRHRGQGKLPILWCDVFQERSRLGERDGQERSEQTDGGIFTPVQTWNIAARVSKCQRSIKWKRYNFANMGLGLKVRTMTPQILGPRGNKANHIKLKTINRFIYQCIYHICYNTNSLVRWLIIFIYIIYVFRYVKLFRYIFRYVIYVFRYVIYI